MSYERLLSTMALNRQFAEDTERESENPTRCPNDGLPLREVDGVRDCPFGDFRWPDNGVR